MAERLISIAGAVAAVVTALGALGVFYGPPLKRWFDKRHAAAALRGRYVPPLVQAAFDLQSRLYNIVRQDFLGAYAGDSRNDARKSTLWLLGQYLGWVEILRREGQFLDFGNRKRNRALYEALGRVASELASDRYRAPLEIFRSEQRAIGELMIKPASDAATAPECLGFAEFVEALEADQSADKNHRSLRRWLQPLSGDLDELAQATDYADLDRLIWVQRALVDLVDELDPRRDRYSRLDLRGRLPAPPAASAGDDRRGDPPAIATFILRQREFAAEETDDDFPWSIFESETGQLGLQTVSAPDRPDARRYARPWAWWQLGARLVVEASCVVVWESYDDQDAAVKLSIYAWAEPRLARGGAKKTRLSLERRAWWYVSSRRRARASANTLLRRFDRPLLR